VQIKYVLECVLMSFFLKLKPYFNIRTSFFSLNFYMWRIESEKLSLPMNMQTKLSNQYFWLRRSTLTHTVVTLKICHKQSDPKIIASLQLTRCRLESETLCRCLFRTNQGVRWKKKLYLLLQNYFWGLWVNGKKQKQQTRWTKQWESTTCFAPMTPSLKLSPT